MTARAQPTPGYGKGKEGPRYLWLEQEASDSIEVRARRGVFLRPVLRDTEDEHGGQAEVHSERSTREWETETKTQHHPLKAV